MEAEEEEVEATQTGDPGGVQRGGSQRGRTTVAWLSPDQRRWLGPLLSQTGDALQCVAVKTSPLACWQTHKGGR